MGHSLETRVSENVVSAVWVANESIHEGYFYLDMTLFIYSREPEALTQTGMTQVGLKSGNFFPF